MVDFDNKTGWKENHSETKVCGWRMYLLVHPDPLWVLMHLF